MEDQFLVLPSLVTDQMAIYDGHGGQLCAQYCKRFMHKHLMRALSSSKGANDNTIEGRDLRVVNALFKTFYETEKGFMFLSKIYDDNSGSCVTMLLIYDDRIYVANLGDSRILLARKKPNGCGVYALPLSRDHKANVEKERIKQTGGFLRDNRVNGILAISRTIGDREFKRIQNRPPKNVDLSSKCVPSLPHDSISSPLDLNESVSYCETALKHAEIFHSPRQMEALKESDSINLNSNNSKNCGNNEDSYNSPISRESPIPSVRSPFALSQVSLRQILLEINHDIIPEFEITAQELPQVVNFLDVDKLKPSLAFKRAPLELKFAPHYVVSATPEISVIGRKPDEHFVLLASDGFYDCFESKEAVRAIDRVMKKNKEADMSLDRICGLLCEDAFHMGSKDDISIIIVRLS